MAFTKEEVQDYKLILDDFLKKKRPPEEIRDQVDIGYRIDKQSIEIFETTPYLDNILEVYPLQSAQPERLENRLRRRIISAHQGRRTRELIEILQNEVKFPYDEPLWFLIKNIQGCLENNPRQIQRIADSLYAMTADETVFRLEI